MPFREPDKTESRCVEEQNHMDESHPKLSAKRKETHERIVQLIKDLRNKLDSNRMLLTDPALPGVLDLELRIVRRQQKVFSCCDDDEALATFVATLVGLWQAHKLNAGC